MNLNQALGIIENAAEHGPQIDTMLEFVHWFMLLLFIGWSAFFVYCLFRFRKAKNPKADYTGVTSKKSLYVEVGVIVVEAVLLLGFAFPLWGKRVNEFPSDKDSTVVRVIAQQFQWNFQYPGPDGVFGKQDFNLVTSENPYGFDPADPAGKDDFVVAKAMHVPLGKNVIVYITSRDVIHSYSIRQMRITQDAIPGIQIPAWFKPIKTGMFEILCAQLCGNMHYAMRGELHVDSVEDYDKWVKEQVASGGAGSGSYD
jgi:cytochrome c oxidase subunit II